jgi:hypothetical protein
MSVSNNKTSHLVSSQVPQFVKDDHTTFVAFLEDYYKFLEQNNQTLNVTKNFTKFKDIDNAEDQFIEKLYDNFISLLPAGIQADRTLITKHVKDFYRARGSEKSVRFLLRILLNKEISFYYPKRDILKASDGKWFIQKSVKLGNVQVNNVSSSTAHSNFVNKKIQGQSSDATAIVEAVDVYYDKGQLVKELKLSNEYKSFIDGETIYCFYEEEAVTYFLSGTLFSGVVSSISLAGRGSGYTEGSSVPVEGGGGTGAQVIISSVTKGSLSSIGVAYGGAGFKVGNPVLITGGGGVDATANVFTVDESETYHPNSYSVMKSLISLESGTAINNVRYSNLNSSIVNPYSQWVQNSMSYWTYSNCGPVTLSHVINTGDHYISNPSLDVRSNTAIRSLGILGRMEIYDGGIDYSVGDELVFTNPIGCYGVGAAANVTAVNATGSITSVYWKQMQGHTIGGSGYDQANFPNITVSSGSGSGANIKVTSIIGDGETLVASAVTYGQILELKLISGGTGYTSTPTINLANMAAGSGGIATASIVTGAYSYPGRFLNDDGFLSAYNFLQDRDYYQNFSYVIRVDEPINKYRKSIKDLTHPAGMKLFGHYLLTDTNNVTTVFSAEAAVPNTKLLLSTYLVATNDITMSGTYNVSTKGATYAPRIVPASYNVQVSTTGTFNSYDSNLVLKSNSHGYVKGDNVYLKFHTSMYSNVVNGSYTVSGANLDYIIVPIANGNSALYSTSQITSNLTLSTGAGATNSWAILSQWTQNSNVAIAVGDTVYVDSSNAQIMYVGNNTDAIVLYPALTGSLSGKKLNIVKKAYPANGNVTINNPSVTIFANSTGLIPSDNVYLKFNSSDTTLINTRYTVTSANATQFTVEHKNIASASSLSGNANVYFNQIVVTDTSHELSNGDPIFIYAYSGDTGNVTNTLYTVSDVTVNTFNITTRYPVSSSGSLNYKTSDVTLNITDHDFNSNDSVYMWFITGDTANVSNGYYTVNVTSSSSMTLNTPNVLSANGLVTVYRGYVNVGISRSSHGFSVGNTVNMLFDSGNLESIANGVYTVNKITDSSTYNVKHTGVVVSSNLSNLLPNNSGDVYVSLHK